MLKQRLNFFNVFVSFLIGLFLFSNSVYTQERGYAESENGMVVSAQNLATKVGVEILKKGGNAVDAAVAVGFTLAVTYPVAGNIGGGGFMVINTKDGLATSIDYREKAPISATRDMYLNENGEPITELSLYGEKASGVPGSVAGMIYALEKYGTMKLKDVIQPAINIAQDGFPLSYSEARMINNYSKLFNRFESSKKVFFKKGDMPYKEGDIFKQVDLANTLIRIRDNGRDGFYKGKTADLIVEQMKRGNGIITYKDLEKYEAIEREPVRGTYRDYEIVSMSPPSSGGIVLLQMLNTLENKKFSREEWGGSEYLYYLAEAMKQAYADRSQHLGDPDFYKVPVNYLISKEYGKKVFSNIGEQAIPSTQIKPIDIKESEQTTHYSIADRFGNAVSVTTTINSGFGSGVIVDGAGFLLNNEMDDFSVKPGVPNQFGLLGNEANAIQPEKRMLSSMTPTIVLKDNKPYIIVGTPGGSTIMTIVLQVILNMLDFDMNVKEANDAPRIHYQWFPDEIQYEKFGMTKDVKDNLQKRGHKIGGTRTLGLIELIKIENDKNRGGKKMFYGHSDKRGIGLAEGY